MSATATAATIPSTRPASSRPASVAAVPRAAAGLPTSFPSYCAR